MTAPQVILGNPLTAFENGVQLDLRAKLAIEFLKAPGMQFNGTLPAGLAKYALDIADELITQADARGWVIPVPDDDSLNAALRTHLRKNVRAQIYQQLQGQKIQQEEMPQVQTAPAGLHAVPPSKLS